MVRSDVRAFPRPRRFIAMGLTVLVVFTALTARLWDLQLINGAHYRSLSEENRVLRLPVDAERGMITDRNGYVLARNLPGFAVMVLPVDLPRGKQDALVAQLGAVLGRDPAEITKIIDEQRIRNPYEPVKVSAKPVARDIALVLSERRELFPGVSVQAQSIRSYTDAVLYSPVLGYVGPITEDELNDLKDQGYLNTALIGRTGLELTYERYLKGTLGWREIERDAAQREIKTLSFAPPVAGNSVVTTIDDRLQKLLDTELRKGVEEDRFTQAVGVALNPQNGEILAMVSIPGYDNNWFVQGITPAQMGQLNADDRHPLVNKAIGEIYPPGSTFKMITGLSALTAGTATRNTVVNVTSTVMTVSGFNFYDWRAHGRLDFLNGFAHSSDIYFYTLAGGSPMGPGVVGAGPVNIAKYGRMLGFGERTGIDLPGEARGIMPDPGWKLATFDEEWTIGNTYHEAIGQGYVAVTPLQLLNAYASVANGGTVYTPHLLKDVRDGQGNVVTKYSPPAPPRKLEMKAEDLRLIREAARRVVTIGHAYMPNLKLPIAGKTGTAEFGASTGKDSAGRNRLGFHNWFVSFVPQQDNTDPTAQIAMVIFTYDSSRSLCDSCINPAVTLTQKIYEAYLLGDKK
ncbi:MAG: penicillin-binding protein 2 [Chloroflexi bacterium]|nr:MAG: penicillin-binding protein 2 [Chloroflexota bacterium]TMC33157.1 MAG: penicillin-binding protein 2 [Chloroflexota bacterium]TMC55838.1 MAG: penicillin-binding protein 2 [Chloroflexota bacterium]